MATRVALVAPCFVLEVRSGLAGACLARVVEGLVRAGGAVTFFAAGAARFVAWEAFSVLDVV